MRGIGAVVLVATWLQSGCLGNLVGHSGTMPYRSIENSFTFNSLVANGLMSNGLLINGVRIANGINLNGLRMDHLTINGVSQDESVKIMRYMVECALPPTSSITLY